MSEGKNGNAKGPEGKNGLAKLITDVGALRKNYDEDRNRNEMWKTEIILKLEEISQGLKNISTAKARSTGAGGTANKPATVVPPKEFPKNSTDWLRTQWKNEESRSVAKKNYLTEANNKTLDDYMTTNEVAKSKEGIARAEVEFNYAWNTIIKTNDAVRKLIKDHYLSAKEAHMQGSLTPANKDDQE